MAFTKWFTNNVFIIYRKEGRWNKELILCYPCVTTTSVLESSWDSHQTHDDMQTHYVQWHRFVISNLSHLVSKLFQSLPLFLFLFPSLSLFHSRAPYRIHIRRGTEPKLWYEILVYQRLQNPLWTKSLKHVIVSERQQDKMSPHIWMSLWVFPITQRKKLGFLVHRQRLPHFAVWNSCWITKVWRHILGYDDWWCNEIRGYIAANVSVLRRVGHWKFLLVYNFPS